MSVTAEPMGGSLTEDGSYVQAALRDPMAVLEYVTAQSDLLHPLECLPGGFFLAGNADAASSEDQSVANGPPG